LRLIAYQDSAGIWTIGVGHTPSNQGAVITEKEALELFDSDIEWSVNAVNQGVTKQLNQDQFDCLVSFVFNVGQGAFKSSTLLKEINKGRFNLAANQLHRWNKITVGGAKVVSGGLVYRRASEIAQWYSILNTKERVCNHKPVAPSGRNVLALIKDSKTTQGSAAIGGISLMQMEDVTTKLSGLNSTWAEMIPTITPYLPVIGLTVAALLIARRWSDSRAGKNH
jgi:lysozyme